MASAAADGSELQTVLLESPRGRVVAVDSAYHARPLNRGRDVVVNGSYSGVLCARFVAQHSPRGAIGVDCAIGRDGAGIAGLWYYEALGLPAATADIATVELGNGVDVFETGVISRINDPAARRGIGVGMTVREAAGLLLDNDAAAAAPSEITNRTVMRTAPSGRQIVCTDSVAFGLEEDRDRNVLCTAGHTGRSSVPYLRKVSPWGFICSDGGKGKHEAGVAGLAIVEPDGLAGASVDARSARMGDGLSTYEHGVISAVNGPAAERGVEVGQSAREAAEALLAEEPG